MQRKSWVYSLIILAVLLLGQEALFRAIFPLPAVSNFNRMDYSNVIPDARKAHPKLMNASYLWTSEPDGVEFTHSLNLYGFRQSINWNIEKSTHRIMFVGDSFVEGLMAPENETIPAEFGRLLAQEGDSSEVMNFGIAGNQVEHYFHLIHDAAPLFKPDTLVLVFYANDFPMDVPPEQMLAVEPFHPVFIKQWMPRILHLVKRAKNHEPLPRRWQASPFPYFPAVPSPGNPIDAIIEARPKDANQYVDADLMAAMKRGTLNPNLVDYISICQSTLKTPIDPKTMLQSLSAFLAKNHTQLYLAYVPHSVQVSDYYLEFWKRFSKNKTPESLTGPGYQIHAKSLVQAAQDLGLPFLDLTAKVRTEEQSGNHLYAKYDNHMTGKGYTLVAQQLHEWMKKAPR